jgi:periplasmic protein TonB
MFENALASSWDEHSRRGVTTLTSFAVQALAVIVLLIVPLLRPTAIPLLRHIATPISLSQPEPEPPQIQSHTAPNSGPHSTVADIVLRQPAQVPHQIFTAGEDPQPPIVGSGPYIPGIQGTSGDGVPGSVGMGLAPTIPKPPLSVEHTVRLSHMSEGDLVRKVLPMYPPLARSARIQGPVVLQAMISKLGTIENLRLLSGHPMLAPAAIDAVRQWRYRPYILSGEPVEVETQITVNFSLAGN